MNGHHHNEKSYFESLKKTCLKKNGRFWIYKYIPNKNWSFSQKNVLIWWRFFEWFKSLVEFSRKLFLEKPFLTECWVRVCFRLENFWVSSLSQEAQLWFVYFWTWNVSNPYFKSQQLSIDRCLLNTINWNSKKRRIFMNFRRQNRIFRQCIKFCDSKISSLYRNGLLTS